MQTTAWCKKQQEPIRGPSVVVMAEAAAEGFRVVAETATNHTVTSKDRERHRNLFPGCSFQKISHVHPEGWVSP